MRKKCVRWAKPVLTCLAALIAMVYSRSSATLTAQTTDPSALPRLAFSDLFYVGGFRLPASSANGDSFSFGGRQLTFNPAGNSLFVGSRAGRVAEVSIPSPVNTSNPDAMPFATYLQPFADPTENRLSEVATSGANLDGLLVYNNRLYGTASIFYDANNTQRVSHYSHSLNLSESSFQGWSQVWETGKSGFVSGMMAVIPAEWQSRLGGPAATGQCCIPIVMRTSWGPSAFAFNPAQVGQPAVAASPLVYYTGDHATLGAWDGSNATYGATIAMGGMAIIAGTRTALYFGRNGTGPHCYGNGTSDPSMNNVIGPDGEKWCYDPTSADKGSHAYPYRYQIWAYDLNDFAAVKAGLKQPWEVVPYAVWPFDVPTPESSVKLGGVGYDAVTQRLYVSQLYADRDGYSYRPVIHTFQVNATPGSNEAPADEPTANPDPAPAPAPVPDTSTVIKSISLAVNRNAPQVAGTPITFTAFAVGGVIPHEYKWLVDEGTGFTAVTGWSVIDTFIWTPGTANAAYRVAVWARSNGNARDEPEASASSPFAITDPVPLPVTAVTLSANKPAPQTVGASITFSATASGGSAPAQYKWLIYDGSPTWFTAQDWSESANFTWTPAAANPNYEIRVFARSKGMTVDAPQAEARTAFPINPAVVPRVDSVSLSADKAAPQNAGTPITFTAVGSGGAGPLQFKFLLYDGSPTWQFLTGWTTAGTFTWTPSAANPNYVMRVWVRSNGNTKDEPEAEAQVTFPISTAPAVVTPVPSTPPPPIGSVVLTTNKPAPQVAGTTIIATATVSGGAAPHQFRWLIHDGGQWQFVTGWTTSNTLTWTPTVPNPNHFIGVWVRSAGSSSEQPEATMSMPFAIR